MHFTRIKWVPLQQIKVRHNTSKCQISDYPIRNKPIIHVIKNKRGDLLLHKGIAAYHVLKKRNQKISIPVYLTNQPSISKLEWTYKLFQSCVRENAKKNLKYVYLILLLNETNNNIQEICQKTDCTKQEIYEILFAPAIPEKYKDLAIKHNRRQLINEIARNPLLQKYKPLLYKATFQEKNPLTFKKLKLFITYIKEGFDLNVNSILALQNLNQIIDKNRALHYYWDHLQFPDTSIMEGIFYYKGDKNSKINVRL